MVRLPPGDRVVLGQAWALFLLVELALRILPFTRVLTLFGHPLLKSRPTPAPESAPSLSRVVWLVEVAGRYAPVKVTCLKTALVGSSLLGKRGIPTRLRIGVARGEGTLAAHAWLEWDGQVLLGHEAIERYEPLLRHVAGPTRETR